MEQWNWPGSRWWKFDLHTHSPASPDFGAPGDRAAPDWARWVQSASDAGLHAVAVTDHNTSGGVAALRLAAEQIPNAPVIFPGLEITAGCGTHLLAILDPSSGAQHIDDVLTKAEVPVGARGSDHAQSELSLQKLLAMKLDGVFIGAHVNGPKGLLGLEGMQRLSVLSNTKLAGVEVCPDIPIDSSYIDGSRAEINKRTLPTLWCSDAHDFDDLGRRFTWIKMSRPDIDGLRLALLDGQESLLPERRPSSNDPNAHADCVVERITVKGAKYMGQVQPLIIELNPWLNALIGGRGTGKSSVVDFCRVAMCRQSELAVGDTDSLAQSFSQRMRKPPTRHDEGLLEDNTTVEVVYRKDGARYLLEWAPPARVSIHRLEGAERIAEEGDVAERFPVRIYSQKQLFALARHPNALLQVIDDSDEVRGAELLRQRREAEATYLSHLASARSLRAQAADLSGRRAMLTDVRRKIEFLEQGAHAETLNRYRSRVKKNEEWLEELVQARATIAAAEAIVDAILDTPEAYEDDAAPSAPAASLSADSDSAATSLESALQGVEYAVKGMAIDIQGATQKATTALAEIQSGDDVRVWREALTDTEKKYDEVVTALTEAGIGNPQEYGGLVVRAASLEQEIKALEAHLKAAEESERKAAVELANYREARRVLSERRGAFAAANSNDLVSIRIDSYAGKEGLTEFLRDALGIDRFEGDYESLAKRVLPASGAAWAFDRLDDTVKKLRHFVADDQAQIETEDRRFASALRRLTPERIDRLALFLPDDSVHVSFKDPRDKSGGWKHLALGSPGQQTAALLAFVLGYGCEPIILDQPEDDLDSTLIYELVVKRLRDTKHKRQIIVVTHNPNVVVHGDAELVVSLSVRKGQTAIECSGGLQETTVRDEICRVLEGGPDAFRKRYRRIMQSAADRELSEGESGGVEVG